MPTPTLEELISRVEALEAAQGADHEALKRFMEDRAIVSVRARLDAIEAALKAKGMLH